MVSTPPPDTHATPSPRPAESRGPRDLSRRTVLTTAAWAAPVVAMTAATPAYASSGNRVASLSSLNDQLPAAGNVSLSAKVVDVTGSPTAGQVVTFSGPPNATFAPATATTNSSGIATTTVNLNDTWATPGSTATITAVAGGSNLSKGFTVLGANVLAFGTGYTTSPTQMELVFPSPVAQISVGQLSKGPWAVALLQNGTVWTKGTNNGGQLGDGTTTDRSTWAQVAGLSTVKQIAIGGDSVMALQSDGTIMRWGADPYDAVSTPKKQAGLANVTQIARSLTAGFALLSDGSVKAWGSNQLYVAGTGGSAWPGTTPQQVVGLTSNVTAISAGPYSGYARMSDGSGRAWGWNVYGQLGENSTTDRETPVNIDSLTGSATQFATALGNLYVLRSDGSVVACGYNDNTGELGNGTTSPRANPALVQVSGLTSGVSAISATYASGYALMTDGSLRAWGWNGSGQLGDGTTTSRITPVSITIPAGRSITRLADTNSAPATTMYVITATS